MLAVAFKVIRWHIRRSVARRSCRIAWPGLALQCYCRPMFKRNGSVSTLLRLFSVTKVKPIPTAPFPPVF